MPIFSWGQMEAELGRTGLRPQDDSWAQESWRDVSERFSSPNLTSRPYTIQPISSHDVACLQIGFQSFFVAFTHPLWVFDVLRLSKAPFSHLLWFSLGSKEFPTSLFSTWVLVQVFVSTALHLTSFSLGSSPCQSLGIISYRYKCRMVRKGNYNLWNAFRLSCFLPDTKITQ